MDKALKMGKDSATGGFRLFIAKIVSTVLLAVSAIIIGIFIEDVEYGLYVIALVPVTTFLLFQDWGVGPALTKYCARYRADKEERNLRKIVVAGLTFEFATGLILSLISFLVSGFVASTILVQPDSDFLIKLCSTAILFTGISVGANAIFVGFERMDLSGFTLICQATVYCALCPLLVYLGYGAVGIILGYTLSYVLSGTLSAILLYFFIFRKLHSYKLEYSEIYQTLKLLLRYGVPLAVGLLASGLLQQFYLFMMSHYCDVAIIGHYKIATNFAVAITFFVIPISTVLFPVFSKINPEEEPELLKSVFSSAIKYTTLFSLPATLAIIVLSETMINTVYGDKWFYSPFFLSLYMIQYLFVSIGAFTNVSLLQGLGETKVLLKLFLLSLFIGIPLAFLLVPSFQIVGLILTSLFAALPSLFLGLHWIWKHFRAKADFGSSGRIFFAATIAGATTYLFLKAFDTYAWIMFTASAILFLVVYLITAPLVGAVSQMDVGNLRVMFSGLGPVSKLLELPLALVEVLLKAKAIGLKSLNERDITR